MQLTKQRDRRVRIFIFVAMVIMIASIVTIWMKLVPALIPALIFSAAAVSTLTQRCPQCGVPYIFQPKFRLWKPIGVCSFCSK